MSETEDDLTAHKGLVPLRKGRASVVRIPNHWFIVALSSELGDSPIERELFGTKLVLFRDRERRACALLDRCPHRNVPLSIGKTASDGTVECAYHGWRFDGAGECRAIPTFKGDCGQKGQRATAFATFEEDGFVWVYSTPLDEKGQKPTSRPHKFEYKDAPGYSTVTQVVSAEGTLYSAIENALDVPHTAFLHRGLFRSKSRGITITAKVKRSADRARVIRAPTGHALGRVRFDRLALRPVAARPDAGDRPGGRPLRARRVPLGGDGRGRTHRLARRVGLDAGRRELARSLERIYALFPILAERRDQHASDRHLVGNLEAIEVDEGRDQQHHAHHRRHVERRARRPQRQQRARQREGRRQQHRHRRPHPAELRRQHQQRQQHPPHRHHREVAEGLPLRGLLAPVLHPVSSRQAHGP